MGRMSQKNRILCEVFDCELEELQLNITLNPTVYRIKQAMELLASKTAWDLWLNHAHWISESFGQGMPIDDKAERAKFELWYENNRKKQNEK
jgi:hypothetical protein